MLTRDMQRSRCNQRIINKWCHPRNKTGIGCGMGVAKRKGGLREMCRSGSRHDTKIARSQFSAGALKFDVMP
jgi:hypothetical protein